MCMDAGWMKVEQMCKAKSVKKQESVGTSEIVLDILKSERN